MADDNRQVTQKTEVRSAILFFQKIKGYKINMRSRKRVAIAFFEK